MTNVPTDTARVIAPPPLIALGTLLLGLILDRLFPIGAAGAMLPGTRRFVIAAVFFAAGIWMVVRALLDFRQVGTPAEPWKPTTALATHGIFRKTRNPMYQAFGILTFALAVVFASDWTILLIVPGAIVMHYGVVRREERYLTAKFGEPYRRYMDEVPRYGWPL